MTMLTDVNGNVLQKKIEENIKSTEIKNEIIGKLKNQHAIETDVQTKSKLAKNIEDAEKERDQLSKELDVLQQQALIPASATDDHSEGHRGPRLLTYDVFLSHNTKD